MLILPVAVWGWRMLTHRTFDREALRLGCWILCTVIAAGFASCWPHGGAWPLPTGLGGVVGDALVRAPAVVFGPPGLDLSPRARHDPVRGDGRDLPVRQRHGLASARGRELTPIEDDDAPFVEEEDDRGSVSLGWAVSCLMSAKARLALAVVTAYRSLVASAPQPRAALVRAPGAESRRPRRAVAGAAGRRGFRGRGRGRRRRGRSSRRPRAAQEGRAARAGAQILRKVRTAVGVGADRAEGLRPPAAEQEPSSKPIRARWKACSAISACAAKSSRPIRARW